MAGILKFISAADEAQLLSAATRRRFKRNEVIVREGSRPAGLYIVRGGEARVERAHGGHSVEVSRLHPGELFGEMGFIEDVVASASVVADGVCEIEIIGEATIHGLIKTDPYFAGRFYRSIAEIVSRRLRATTAEGLSEFSWGTGFAHPEEPISEAPTEPTWGGDDPFASDR